MRLLQRFLVFIIVPLLLVACSHVHATRIITARGEAGMFIECRRTVDCFQQAGLACPYGYDVENDTSHTEGVYYADRNVAVAKRYNVRELLVVCHLGPDGKTPEEYYESKRKQEERSKEVARKKECTEKQCVPEMLSNMDLAYYMTHNNRCPPTCDDL